jgi:hypothetical protein
MDEMERLIQLLNEARREMHASLALVDTTQEVYPDWSLREMLAHISGWDQVTRKGIEAYLRGGKPFVLPPQGFDQTNAEMATTREGLSSQQVLEDCEQERASLIRAIRQIPAEHFSSTLTFPWGSEGTMLEMIEIIAEHEEHHARELAALVEQT